MYFTSRENLHFCMSKRPPFYIFKRLSFACRRDVYFYRSKRPTYFHHEFGPLDTKIVCSVTVYVPTCLSIWGKVLRETGCVGPRGSHQSLSRLHDKSPSEGLPRPKSLLHPLYSVCRDRGPTIYHVHRKTRRGDGEGYRSFSHLSRIYNRLSAWSLPF